MTDTKAPVVTDPITPDMVADAFANLDARVWPDGMRFAYVSCQYQAAKYRPTPELMWFISFDTETYRSISVSAPSLEEAVAKCLRQARSIPLTDAEVNEFRSWKKATRKGGVK